MRFKLYLVLILLVTAVLLASSMFSYLALRTELNARFEEHKQGLTKRLQVNLGKSLWNYDKSQADSIVEAEFNSPDIVSIRVYETVFETAGAENSLFASRIRYSDDSKSVELAKADEEIKVILSAKKDGSYTRPADESVELGYALIGFSRQHVEQLLHEQIRNRLLEIIILDSLLGLLLFVVMNRIVISPLSQLSHAFKDLAQNSEFLELKIKGNDEFGEVVDAFNQIERRLVSDINLRIEAEKKLRVSNDELTAALDTLKMAQDSLVQTEKFASLGSLVAGVAHEINTPVGVTVTLASFLVEETQKMEKKLNEGNLKKSEFLQFNRSVAESAQLMQNSAERAAHLIHSFKQVAADETSEARRQFDLTGYLDEVLTSLRPKYKKTGINVHYSSPDGVLMDTYPGLLTQVITNLITNALTHGFDAGAVGEISLCASTDGVWVDIECANNGKIIPKMVISKIFDPFFTTRRSDGGTGLGLNIVFNIVTQRLGGTIKVSSEEGEGTKFTVHIPRVLGEKGNGAKNGH